ncbi:MAG: FAD-dependent oxidoreductase [Rubrobacteraceae bacterium]|nr:FAD-dependent oxidoreductase [Rubrobacteraceae bacterium]MBA3616653.1 FAD-dependent oxidoreductase [Rubrobacteraceae bacterium]MDQ3437869.1 FAD-dependent oxidoreductase [Actinomycetota bacterium]
MAKPVILAVDDDPQVLRAVERDLRRRYAREYRILRADSGESALDTLGKLKLRGDPVALFLVDQRMPKMTGVEFLEEAIEHYPEAKRALLTAYSDTEAAIRAINEVGLDYYLQKPWDPPDENLYPNLDDMLGDWRADYRPPFTGLRVVGDRWSPESHRTREFLARNRVPYRWLDVEGSEEAREILTNVDAGAPKLPLIVYEDGSYAEAPENLEIAEKIGLKTRAGQRFYDLVIVGGGPSGLAAAVYGASEGLKTVIIEREAPGGQAGTSSRIENYLGFPAGLSGGDLARRAVDQARRFEVEILTPQEVSAVRAEDPYRIVTLADGTEISCYAMIITTGVSYRKLNAPGVERLTGRGIYYGAAQTEALSCKDEDVYIVGGANSAGQAAMFFSSHARKLFILHRGDDLRKSMSDYLVRQIEARDDIEVLLDTNVVAVEGEDHLERITAKNTRTGETETVPAHSLFIFIGAVPTTDWLDGVVERDERGFLLSGPDLMQEGKRPEGWRPDRDPFLLETSVPGIFVAGDVRHGSVKRCASAVGEGSIAVQFVHQYMREV